MGILTELTLKKNNNNCKQWDGINDIYEIYPPKVADAVRLQNLSAYTFENTKITVKIHLRSNNHLLIGFARIEAYVYL